MGKKQSVISNKNGQLEFARKNSNRESTQHGNNLTLFFEISLKFQNVSSY